MAGDEAFGKFAKGKRMELGLTLREFCRKYGYDPGNMSKIERGLLAPPRRRADLQSYARALDLQEGSDDWLTFFDLAAVSAGRIPERILSDKELVPKLPLVFRTIAGKPLSPDALKKLSEVIRRA